MKVIITGGEGFIGKALAVCLSNLGCEVISVDRKIGIEAIDFFSNDSNLNEVDCVYHLAAQTSVFNTNHTQIMHDNIETFMAVCDACQRVGVKLVYASSSTAEPCNTTSLYGISKAFAEQYARCYYPEATGVRFHNVYGPEPRQGTLLWYLLTQDSVRLYNLGRNVRHFTYIDDICDGLAYAALSDLPLVNIANPEETTTLQLAREVYKYKPLEIELVTKIRDFDRKEQKVNESVFTLHLSYTSVSEGIRRIFSDKEK